MIGDRNYSAILLSDNKPSQPFGFGRYAGPYKVASSLEEQGFPALVIDYFLSLPDPVNYICSFVSKDTKVIGISSTFLSIHQTKVATLTERFSAAEIVRAKTDFFWPYLWAESDLSLFDWLWKLKSAARKINPDILFLVGGGKTTNMYQLCREPSMSVPFWYKAIDYFVLGFSDAAILPFIKEGAQGVAFQEIRGTKFVFGPKQFPPREFNGIGYKKHWAIQAEEWLPIEISRGCAFSCKFCNYFKREPNFKNVEILRDEFLRNYEQFGITGYHFSDDCFNDNYKKVVTLTDMFASLPFKLEWVSYARTDLCHRYPDIIDRMVGTGARGLFFGLESLSHEPARFAGKPLHPDAVKSVLEDLRRKGGDQLNIAASLIIGLPRETPESLEETLVWLKTQTVLDSITFAPLAVFKSALDELDDSIMDFSDYTKNPERYGFEEVRGYYWRHKTMDSDKAMAICMDWERELKGHHAMRDKHVFSYPRIRSLGFSHEQASRFLGEKSFDAVAQAEKRWISRYHESLKTVNTRGR